MRASLLWVVVALAAGCVSPAAEGPLGEADGAAPSPASPVTEVLEAAYGAGAGRDAVILVQSASLRVHRTTSALQLEVEHVDGRIAGPQLLRIGGWDAPSFAEEFDGPKVVLHVNVEKFRGERVYIYLSPAEKGWGAGARFELRATQN